MILEDIVQYAREGEVAHQDEGGVAEDGPFSTS